MAAQHDSIGRAVIRQLGRLRLEAAVTDRELLQRFALERDEAAFEALVRRHAAMVLAVGRRVLGNANDAEDVCQAAFLLLAQKAASDRWQPSVANWLHQTAHHLALRAQRAVLRRARREGQVAARLPDTPLAAMTAQELLAALDRELLALPESLRAPLVLCYLQGATRDEAADRLGCPLSTLKKRLERGRQALHRALVRRGLGLSAGLLGAFLGRDAVAGLPPALARKTIEAGVAALAGTVPAGMITPQVAQLLHQGLAMTRWTRTKAMLAILFAGALLAALLTSGASQERPGAAPPQEVAAPVRKEEPAAEPTREVRVRVVDPEGRPLPGADIHVSVWTDEKGFKRNRDLPTDDEGVARVELPKQYSIVRLWASKKPLVSLFANWERAELASGQRLPAVYTFRLERAASAAGRILDTAGRPVSGARVQVELADGPAPAAADHRVSYNPWLASGSDAATTDADGRWKIDNVPDRPGVELRLLVTHPDFVPENESSRGTAQALREGTAALSLRPGVIVRGRVTDADGRPVQDAVLIHGDDPYHEQTTSKVAADSTGRYRLPALPTGPTSVTVLAPGFAPLLRKVDLQPGLPDQDFRLAPGKPVRLRIVNGAGRPIPQARVWLMEWNGSKSVYTDHNPNHPKVPDSGIPRQADAQGVWHWPSAPDGPVTVHVFANGFASQDLEVTGGAAERTVRLKAEHRISGAVTDAVSGRPIPAFSVIPVDVFAKNHLSTERFNAVAGRDGRLDFLASRTDIPLRLRVEAAGYRTQDGPEFRVGDDTSRRQDFRLAPSPPRTGRVVDAAGTPVAGAEVLLATPTETARMSDTRDNHRALTDASGRFEFPDPGEPWAVLVRSDSGVASAALAPDRADAGTLALRPWASLRGTFSDAGRPVSRATVFVHPVRLAAAGQPRLDDALQTVTGPDGTFAFPQVPPGPVCVRVHLGPWQDEGFRSAPSVPLELRPGERAQLALGSGGATLTGRVRLTGMVPAGLDCTYSLNHLVRREAGIAPPAEVAAAGFDVRHGWRQAWEKTPEGHTYLSTLHSWFVKLAPDGSFRVSGVPPGEYDLSVAVYGKPNGCLIDPLARRVVRVAVTAADAARGEVALPDTMAEVVPVPAVGDTPDLSFARPDGTSGVLAEFRGKPIVLHFWASWCLSCKAQLPALKALHQRFPDRGVAVLGLALDEDPAAWHAALESLQLPWAQGRAAASRVPGVSSVPAYWLLDPAGRIVAKTYDVDELARALDDVVK